MKSSQLRAKLEEMEKKHGDWEVITEGCDCTGESGDVVVWNFHYHQFVIARDTPEEAEARRQDEARKREQLRELDKEIERKTGLSLP